MTWLQLKLLTDEQQAETISSLLQDLGAIAVSFQDAQDEAVLEPALGTTPLWTQTWVIALFPVETNLDGLLLLLQQQLPVGAITQLQHEVLADQEWERAWLQDFHPLQFGTGLWVVPSTHTPPDPNAANLILDPGLAFGTGTHPTTALCLAWLANHPPIGQDLIDYGCGSGILALAALKLGAEQVWAVDYDEQALTATHNNAEVNQLLSKPLHILLPEALPSITVDTLLANILINPLLELAPQFARLVKARGNIVLSGILPEQVESLAQCYSVWFELSQPQYLDGWALVSGIRRS